MDTREFDPAERLDMELFIAQDASRTFAGRKGKPPAKGQSEPDSYESIHNLFANWILSKPDQFAALAIFKAARDEVKMETGYRCPTGRLLTTCEERYTFVEKRLKPKAKPKPKSQKKKDKPGRSQSPALTLKDRTKLTD